MNMKPDDAHKRAAKCVARRAGRKSEEYATLDGRGLEGERVFDGFEWP